MPSVRKSIALSFAENYSVMIIGTISVMVLARLLTPEEIGIFSVGAAAVALAHAMRDLGVSDYLIWERELTTERIRTAFAVTLIIGWTLAAVLIALSGPVSDFYNNPGLRLVLRVLSLTFLVMPFGSPILALLQRDMAFGVLLRINVASALVHATTAIALAALGFGFMSLAWASVTGVLATALLAAVYRPSIARVLPSFKEWRRVLSFGGFYSLSTLLDTMGMKTPDLVIGRLLGFVAMGYFSRAQGLMQMFNRTVMHAVMPVITPAFAAKHRSGDSLLDPYLKGLSYVTVLAWPFFIFLGLMAYPIIRILFGDQWDAAVPLVQLLCLSSIFRPLYYFVPPIFIALGEVRRQFRMEMIIQPLRILLITLAALHSLEAVALTGGVVVAFLTFIITYNHLRVLIGLSLRGVIQAVYKSIAVAVSSAMAPAIIFLIIDVGPDNLWLPLLLALPGTAALWVGSIFVLKHPFWEEICLLWQKVRMGNETKSVSTT